MSSTWNGLSRSMRALLVLLGSTCALGGIFGFATLGFTIAECRLHELPVCLSNDCVRSTLGVLDQAFVIWNATLQILVGIATTGGILVALMSYTSTAKNEAFANHIAHIQVFKEFVQNEVARRNRIHASSVDTMHLYNLIFPRSRHGRTDVSDGYRAFVEGISLQISASNGAPAFRYKAHQTHMRRIMAVAGIHIEFLPRNDFFEVEGELISLVKCINESFCFPGGNIPEIPQRKYF